MIAAVEMTNYPPEARKGLEVYRYGLEHEVLLQFLVEAVVLSSLGGIIGVILAIAVSAWLAGILLVPFIVNPDIIIIAFAFSVAVGICFGYFPARKAARLDPIEALRHE
jgi:putative ABC transport system permease protein